MHMNIPANTHVSVFFEVDGWYLNISESGGELLDRRGPFSKLGEAWDALPRTLGLGIWRRSPYVPKEIHNDTP